MTRKLGRPTPNDVRCPTCSFVGWQRVGERIREEPSDGGESKLVHTFERGDGPWEWTCERCGFAVRPTGAIDNALARVQRPIRVPAIIGALLGGGAGGAAGAGDGSAPGAVTNAVRALQVGAVAVAGVAVIAAAALLGRPAPSAPPSASPPAATTQAGPVTDLEALAGAGADVAGRRLELERAEVARVTGDTTFWLGDAGAETFVVLDEERQPEASVTVRAGQQVRIAGTVHETPPGDVDLSADDRASLEDSPVYVVADEVEVVEE